jgi:hypothetical protein
VTSNIGGTPLTEFATETLETGRDVRYTVAGIREIVPRNNEDRNRSIHGHPAIVFVSHIGALCKFILTPMKRLSSVARECIHHILSAFEIISTSQDPRVKIELVHAAPWGMLL